MNSFLRNVKTLKIPAIKCFSNKVTPSLSSIENIRSSTPILETNLCSKRSRSLPPNLCPFKPLESICSVHFSTKEARVENSKYQRTTSGANKPTLKILAKFRKNFNQKSIGKNKNKDKKKIRGFKDQFYENPCIKPENDTVRRRNNTMLEKEASHEVKLVQSNRSLHFLRTTSAPNVDFKNYYARNLTSTSKVVTKSRQKDVKALLNLNEEAKVKHCSNNNIVAKKNKNKVTFHYLVPEQECRQCSSKNQRRLLDFFHKNSGKMGKFSYKKRNYSSYYAPPRSETPAAPQEMEREVVFVKDQNLDSGFNEKSVSLFNLIKLQSTRSGPHTNKYKFEEKKCPDQYLFEEDAIKNSDPYPLEMFNDDSIAMNLEPAQDLSSKVTKSEPQLSINHRPVPEYTLSPRDCNRIDEKIKRKEQERKERKRKDQDEMDEEEERNPQNKDEGGSCSDKKCKTNNAQEYSLSPCDCPRIDEKIKRKKEENKEKGKRNSKKKPRRRDPRNPNKKAGANDEYHGDLFILKELRSQDKLPNLEYELFNRCGKDKCKIRVPKKKNNDPCKKPEKKRHPCHKKNPCNNNHTYKDLSPSNSPNWALETRNLRGPQEISTMEDSDENKPSTSNKEFSTFKKIQRDFVYEMKTFPSHQKVSTIEFVLKKPCSDGEVSHKQIPKEKKDKDFNYHKKKENKDSTNTLSSRLSALPGSSRNDWEYPLATGQDYVRKTNAVNSRGFKIHQAENLSRKADLIKTHLSKSALAQRNSMPVLTKKVYMYNEDGYNFNQKTERPFLDTSRTKKHRSEEKIKTDEHFEEEIIESPDENQETYFMTPRDGLNQKISDAIGTVPKIEIGEESKQMLADAIKKMIQPVIEKEMLKYDELKAALGRMERNLERTLSNLQFAKSTTTVIDSARPINKRPQTPKVVLKYPWQIKKESEITEVSYTPEIKEPGKKETGHRDPQRRSSVKIPPSARRDIFEDPREANLNIAFGSKSKDQKPQKKKCFLQRKLGSVLGDRTPSAVGKMETNKTTSASKIEAKSKINEKSPCKKEDPNKVADNILRQSHKTDPNASLSQKSVTHRADEKKHCDNKEETKETMGRKLDPWHKETSSRQGDSCKKEDSCNKEDPCKKADSCKKEDPCKKADPCKKEDPCKKADPCKKEDPCKKADPCPKADPCKKTDPCPKADSCKKPDPCKKEDSCKKPDPCKKSCSPARLPETICKVDPCSNNICPKKEDSCSSLNRPPAPIPSNACNELQGGVITCTKACPSKSRCKQPVTCQTRKDFQQKEIACDKSPGKPKIKHPSSDRKEVSYETCQKIPQPENCPLKPECKTPCPKTKQTECQQRPCSDCPVPFAPPNTCVEKKTPPQSCEPKKGSHGLPGMKEIVKCNFNKNSSCCVEKPDNEMFIRVQRTPSQQKKQSMVETKKSCDPNVKTSVPVSSKKKGDKVESEKDTRYCNTDVYKKEEEEKIRLAEMELRNKTDHEMACRKPVNFGQPLKVIPVKIESNRMGDSKTLKKSQRAISPSTSTHREQDVKKSFSETSTRTTKKADKAEELDKGFVGSCSEKISDLCMSIVRKKGGKKAAPIVVLSRSQPIMENYGSYQGMPISCPGGTSGRGSGGRRSNDDDMECGIFDLFKSNNKKSKPEKEKFIDVKAMSRSKSVCNDSKKGKKSSQHKSEPCIPCKMEDYSKKGAAGQDPCKNKKKEPAKIVCKKSNSQMSGEDNDPYNCVKRKSKQKEKKESRPKEDPCKKKEDPCKKKEDPCKKKEDPCKKKEDHCKKKEDPCKKKEDPCKKKADPCKKKEDPCKKKEDPCKKKEDPCKKKEDPCKKKEDPCKKKEDPCKKKEDPCKKKEDPCKKKEDPCKKKEDPCKKKEDPCKKKDDPCKKKEDSTKGPHCNTTKKIDLNIKKLALSGGSKDDKKDPCKKSGDSQKSKSLEDLYNCVKTKPKEKVKSDASDMKLKDSCKNKSKSFTDCKPLVIKKSNSEDRCKNAMNKPIKTSPGKSAKKSFKDKFPWVGPCKDRKKSKHCLLTQASNDCNKTKSDQCVNANSKEGKNLKSASAPCLSSKNKQDTCKKRDAMLKKLNQKDSGTCKKKEDPCKKKEDPCKKKEDPCKKKEDPCKKKEDPCKKKEDPCKKKEDPCKKKEDPCKKKEDPCKKKEDPCKKKEDPCKKKEDPCKKKEDPCKKNKESMKIPHCNATKLSLSDTSVAATKPREDPRQCKSGDNLGGMGSGISKELEDLSNCIKMNKKEHKRDDSTSNVQCKKEEDSCEKKEDPCKKKEDHCKKGKEKPGKLLKNPCQKKKENTCEKKLDGPRNSSAMSCSSFSSDPPQKVCSPPQDVVLNFQLPIFSDNIITRTSVSQMCPPVFETSANRHFHSDSELCKQKENICKKEGISKKMDPGKKSASNMFSKIHKVDSTRDIKDFLQLQQCKVSKPKLECEISNSQESPESSQCSASQKTIIEARKSRSQRTLRCRLAVEPARCKSKTSAADIGERLEKHYAPIVSHKDSEAAKCKSKTSVEGISEKGKKLCEDIKRNKRRKETDSCKQEANKSRSQNSLSCRKVSQPAKCKSETSVEGISEKGKKLCEDIKKNKRTRKTDSCEQSSMSQSSLGCKASEPAKCQSETEGMSKKGKQLCEDLKKNERAHTTDICEQGNKDSKQYKDSEHESEEPFSIIKKSQCTISKSTIIEAKESLSQNTLRCSKTSEPARCRSEHSLDLGETQNKENNDLDDIHKQQDLCEPSKSKAGSSTSTVSPGAHCSASKRTIIEAKKSRSQSNLRCRKLSEPAKCKSENFLESVSDRCNTQSKDLQRSQGKIKTQSRKQRSDDSKQHSELYKTSNLQAESSTSKISQGAHCSTSKKTIMEAKKSRSQSNLRCRKASEPAKCKSENSLERVNGRTNKQSKDIQRKIKTQSQKQRSDDSKQHNDPCRTSKSKISPGAHCSASKQTIIKAKKSRSQSNLRCRKLSEPAKCKSENSLESVSDRCNTQSKDLQRSEGKIKTQSRKQRSNDNKQHSELYKTSKSQAESSTSPEAHCSTSKKTIIEAKKSRSQRTLKCRKASEPAMCKSENNDTSKQKKDLAKFKFNSNQEIRVYRRVNYGNSLKNIDIKKKDELLPSPERKHYKDALKSNSNSSKEMDALQNCLNTEKDISYHSKSSPDRKKYKDSSPKKDALRSCSNLDKDLIKSDSAREDLPKQPLERSGYRGIIRCNVKSSKEMKQLHHCSKSQKENCQNEIQPKTTQNYLKYSGPMSSLEHANQNEPGTNSNVSKKPICSKQCEEMCRLIAERIYKRYGITPSDKNSDFMDVYDVVSNVVNQKEPDSTKKSDDKTKCKVEDPFLKSKSAPKLLKKECSIKEADKKKTTKTEQCKPKLLKDPKLLKSKSCAILSKNEGGKIPAVECKINCKSVGKKESKMPSKNLKDQVVSKYLTNKCSNTTVSNKNSKQGKLLKACDSKASSKEDKCEKGRSGSEKDPCKEKEDPCKVAQNTKEKEDSVSREKRSEQGKLLKACDSKESSKEDKCEKAKSDNEKDPCKKKEDPCGVAQNTKEKEDSVSREKRSEQGKLLKACDSKESSKEDKCETAKSGNEKDPCKKKEDPCKVAQNTKEKDDSVSTDRRCEEIIKEISDRLAKKYEDTFKINVSKDDKAKNCKPIKNSIASKTCTDLDKTESHKESLNECTKTSKSDSKLIKKDVKAVTKKCEVKKITQKDSTATVQKCTSQSKKLNCGKLLKARKSDPCKKAIINCKKEDPCAKDDSSKKDIIHCKKEDPCTKDDSRKKDIIHCKKEDPCAKDDSRKKDIIHCKKEDPCAKDDSRKKDIIHCKKEDPCAKDDSRKKDIIHCKKEDPCQKETAIINMNELKPVSNYLTNKCKVENKMKMNLDCEIKERCREQKENVEDKSEVKRRNSKEIIRCVKEGDVTKGGKSKIPLLKKNKDPCQKDDGHAELKSKLSKEIEEVNKCGINKSMKGIITNADVCKKEEEPDDTCEKSDSKLSKQLDEVNKCVKLIYKRNEQNVENKEDTSCKEDDPCKQQEDYCKEQNHTEEAENKNSCKENNSAAPNYSELIKELEKVNKCVRKMKAGEIKKRKNSNKKDEEEENLCKKEDYFSTNDGSCRKQKILFTKNIEKSSEIAETPCKTKPVVCKETRNYCIKPREKEVSQGQCMQKGLKDLTPMTPEGEEREMRDMGVLAQCRKMVKNKKTPIITPISDEEAEKLLCGGEHVVFKVMKLGCGEKMIRSENQGNSASTECPKELNFDEEGVERILKCTILTDKNNRERFVCTEIIPEEKKEQNKEDDSVQSIRASCEPKAKPTKIKVTSNKLVCRKCPAQGSNKNGDQRLFQRQSEKSIYSTTTGCL